MFLRHFKIFKALKLFHRYKSDQAINAKSLKFYKYGKPTEVIEICEEQLAATNPHQVLVKILAAPIHPADLELIQGVRAGKDKDSEVGLPITPGIECVAEVIGLGSNVKEFQVGQRVVVPYAEGRGTWTTHALYNVNDLAAVPNDMPIETAALLTVSPCTAYRILKDFVALKPGDSVLLNGSNSALGQAVHQLCKTWEINSVGLVRDRADMDEVKAYIKKLGATEVLCLDELKKSKIFESGALPKPRLSLSCVARSSSRELGHYLDQNGIMVTYGCMAGQPVATATAAFIFKDFVQRPFWMTRWSKYNPSMEERENMLNELCCLIQNNEFQPPENEMIPFEKYKEAIEATQNYKGYKAKKFILDMRDENETNCSV